MNSVHRRSTIPATDGYVPAIGASAAMLVTITAIAPPMLVVVAMMITIVISLAVSVARPGDDAGGGQCYQPQHDTGSNYALCTCHKCSSALVFFSIAHARVQHRPLIPALDVGAAPTSYFF
jgi:hypothetical protein